MAAPYSIPNNITGLGSIATYIYGIDHMFFNMFLITFWIIIFIWLKSSNNSAGSSWTVASFVIFIISLLLNIVQVIHSQALFFSLIMTVVGFVWMWQEFRS